MTKSELEQLQIGDYVYWCAHEKVVKVKGFKYNQEKDENLIAFDIDAKSQDGEYKIKTTMYQRAPSIERIPLTKELLSKNGFFFGDRSCIGHDVEMILCQDYKKYSKDGTISMIPRYIYHGIVIEYLDEFQRALRLVKSYLINNLKVE